MTADEMLASNAVQVRDRDGALTRSIGQIRTAIDSTLRLVSRLLPVTAVDITVIADARRAIQGYGVGGFTPTANTVEISVDPTFADTARTLGERIAQTLAHELHHAIRERGPGYGRSLFESLISEGLADHFAVEALRIPPPPWTHALNGTASDALLDSARTHFDDRPYDHAKWFFGSTRDIPQWTGYTLGYRLVSAYLAENPGQNATTLVDAPARVFRP